MLRTLVVHPSTVIFLLFGALLGIYLVYVLNDDPGYLLLVVDGWSFETSIVVALGALFLAIFAIFVLYRILVWVLDRDRGQKSARKKTAKGMVAFAEGNFSKAEKTLVKAARKVDSPIINYITAAQAAHEQGNTEKRDAYLREANESDSGLDAAVSITKARLQFDAQQYEQCLASLMLLQQHPGSPGYVSVLKMFADVYYKLEDWPNLRNLLGDLKKRKVLGKDKFERYERAAYRGLLSRVNRADSLGAQREHLNKAWDSLPRGERLNPELVTIYCQRLIDLDAGSEAEETITQFLKKGWNDNLVDLYGKIKSKDAGARLQQAKEWLEERPGDSVLLLTLGRLAMQTQDNQQAQRYLEDSLKSRQSAEAHDELGRLFAVKGDHKTSYDHLRKGMDMLRAQGAT